jgi:hypothetical protein
MTLALYRRRAFRKKVCTSTVLRRAFDKAVRRKPPVVAADAGPMQIQLREGRSVLYTTRHFSITICASFSAPPF